jgi:division protein CdvB (Snf7/Vps24/ESCRT-III family)
MSTLEIIQAIQMVVQIITTIHTVLENNEDVQAVISKLKSNIGDFNDKVADVIEKVYNDMKDGVTVMPSTILSALEKADIFNLIK